MGILTDPDKPDREQRELRAGKDKTGGVTATADKYGGIYTERELLCAAASSAMLLNYWCCFRTPKCETRENLCILSICRQPELSYTSEAVSSSCELICKELRDLRRTRRFFCSFHLHREIDHQAYLRQIRSAIYSSMVFTGLIRKKKSLFESVRPFSWQGFSISFHRGTLFDLGDSCCSAPRCSLLLWLTPPPLFKIRPRLCVTPKTTK